jgi:hypothetical protein
MGLKENVFAKSPGFLVDMFRSAAFKGMLRIVLDFSVVYFKLQ